LTLQAASLANSTAGQIGSGTSLNATISGDATNDGAVVAGDGFSLTAATLETGSSSSLGALTGNTTLAITGAANNAGLLVANSGDLQFSAASLINSNFLTGDSSARVTVSGALSNRAVGVIAAQAGVLTLAAGSLANASGGQISAASTLSATIAGDVTNGGSLVGDTGLTLTAATLETASGSGLGAATGNAGITISGAASNAGTIAASAGNLTFSAASLENSGALTGHGMAYVTTTAADGIDGLDSLINSGTVAANTGALQLSTAALDNTGAIGAGTTVGVTVGGDATNDGAIVGTTDFTLSAETLEMGGGSTLGTTAGDAGVTLAGALSNAGTIDAGTSSGATGNLTVNTASISNSGSLQANGAVKLTTTAGSGPSGAPSLQNNGTIAASAGALTIATANLDNNNKIGTSGGLTANISGYLSNDGTIVGGTGLTLYASTLENNLAASALGALTGNADLTLSDGVSNAGAISATTGSIYLSAAALTNFAGANLYAGLAGTLNIAGGVSNGGTIVANGGGLTINAYSLTNQAGGEIGAGGVLNATLAGTISNTGLIAGDSGLNLVSQDPDLDNAGGTIASTNGSIGITSGAVTNTNGIIQATNGNVTINAVSLTGDGILNAGGTLSVSLQTDFTNINTITGGSVNFSTAGYLTNDNQVAARSGNESISAAGITNSGILAANALLTISAGYITNTDTGLLYGSGGINATIAGAIDNDQGAIIANANTLALTAGSIDNLSGLIQSTGGDVTITAGSVTNEVAGGVSSGGPSTLVYSVTFGNTSGSNDTSYGNYETDNLTGVTTALPDLPAYPSPGKANKYYFFIVLDPIDPNEEFIFQGEHAGHYATVTGYESTVTLNGAPALIEAADNLTFNNAAVTNNASDIVAGGNVAFNGGSLNNVAYLEQESFYLTCPGSGSSGGANCSAIQPSDPSLQITSPASLPLGMGTIYVPRTELWFTANVTGGASSIVSAGGSITGDLTGAVDNTSIVSSASSGTLAGYSTNPVAISNAGALNSNAQSVGGVSAGSNLPGFSGNGSGLSAITSSAALGASGTASGNLASVSSIFGLNSATARAGALAGADGGTSLQAPSATNSVTTADILKALPGGNALFVANPVPVGGYLIDTRYQDTQTGLIGSTYLLDRLGINPSTAPPFLGDSGFDTQYISEQIIQDTGHEFLTGYATQDDEIAALYNNAAASAASMGLTLGTALTPTQQAALTSDMVWYVNETVNGQTVLVPELYLSPSDATVTPNGAVIAAQNISLTATSVTNTDGTIEASDSLSLTATAGSIENLASISNIAVTGGSEQLFNGGGTISAGGNLALQAVDSITSLGSTISAGGDLTAVAQNINLGVVTVATADALTSKNKASTYDSLTNIGSTITAGGDLTLAATGDLDITASAVNATGTALLLAGNDVNITTATNNVDSTSSGHSSGFFSSSSYSDSSHTQTVLQSTVTGADVTIGADSDVNITGSNVAALENVAITAGGAVTIGVTAEQNSSSAYSSQHGFGAAISGAGFGIGEFGSSTNGTESSTTQIGSNIGAVSGNLTIAAGTGPLTATASTLYAGNDLTLVGPSVALNDAINSETQSETQKQNFSGLTVSLGGAAGAVAGAAQQAVQSEQSGNSTLAALQGAEGVAQGYEGYSNYTGAKTPTSANQLAQIDISLTGSGSKSTSTGSATQAVGDTLSAGNNVLIDATNGDVTATAASITAGNDASILAAQNILLQSGQDTTGSTSSSHSSSGSIGVFVGAGGGYGVQASGSLAQSNGNGNAVTQVNSTVSAGNTLSLISGGNTTLAGAQGSAANIIADIGGDLNIVSQQNTESDQYTSNSGSASVQVGAAGGSGSGSFSNSSVNNNGQSVGAGQQSGLTASQTLNAIIAGNTNLDGGILSAPAGSLTTGSLTVENIQNQYASSGSTVSLSAGAQGYMPSGVLPGGSSTSGSGSGTTYGTIASGITINSGSTIPADLNRDTTIANGAVNDNFNLAKTETQLETQQLGATLFGQAANTAAGALISQQHLSETSPEALALHAVIGLAEGAISGGGNLGTALSSGAGAAAGTYTAAQLQSYLLQDYMHGGGVNPYTAEGQEVLALASAAVGAGVGALTGSGSASVNALGGSSAAANSTIYNEESAADEDASRPLGPNGQPLTDQEIADSHDYYAAYNELKALDPNNPAITAPYIYGPDWIPSEQDAANMAQALATAQEVYTLNNTSAGQATVLADAPVGTETVAQADQAALAANGEASGAPNMAGGSANAATAKKLAEQLQQENLDNIASQSPLLAEAINGIGNFSIGSGTASEANALGQIWVGDGYTVASDGTTLISADGTRVYRPPVAKPNTPPQYNPTGVQANFVQQSINPITGQATIISNGHMIITP